MTHRAPTTATFALALAACLVPLCAAAGESKDNPFRLEIEVGAEYDSNVAVLELDRSAGEGDLAALIDLGLKVDAPLAERVKLKLGYDYSQTLHERFDAFDLRSHRGSAELAFDLTAFETGVAYRHADAALDGDGFLELTQVAPYVARKFGERLYLRAGFTRSEKTFDAQPGRDATQEAWSLDGFVFLDGARRYVVFGYRRVEEEAGDAAFDYDGDTLKLRGVRRLGSGARGPKLTAGAQFETRDYRRPPFGLGANRRDERLGLELELRQPLGEYAFARLRYRYNDNRSNLAAVDFDEHVLSLAVGGKF